jgi:type IV pilus assembly protein PilO
MNIALLQQIFKARQRSFICILILLILNVGLYAYSAAYQEPLLAGLQIKWAEKRRLAAGEAVMDMATVYRQGTSDLAAWRKRIAPKKEFARFIGDLFEAAGNNSLHVGAITYKPEPVKGEDLLAYSIGFNVSGKYAAIKSFIADMERLRDIAVIDNISLDGRASEESVALRLQLTAYFRVEAP